MQDVLLRSDGLVTGYHTRQMPMTLLLRGALSPVMACLFAKSYTRNRMNRCVRCNAGCRDGGSYLWSALNSCASGMHFRSNKDLPHDA